MCGVNNTMIINKETGITTWEPDDFDVEYYREIVEKHNIGQDARVLINAISWFYSAFENEVDENKSSKGNAWDKQGKDSELYEKYFNLVQNALDLGSISMEAKLKHTIYNCTDKDGDKAEIAESLLNLLNKALQLSERTRKLNLEYTKEIGWKIPSEKTAAKKCWMLDVPTD